MEEEKDFYKYFNEECDLHDSLLGYFENDIDYNFFSENLTQYFEKIKNPLKRDDLMIILRILVAVSNNHYRCSNFFQKIEKILLYFKCEIKKIFLNDEIFDFFKSNKRLLLFFIKENILTLNEKIVKDFDDSNLSYFAPEINIWLQTNSKVKINKEKLDQVLKNVQDFEQKRHEGENEEYICQIIRNDAVEEFIAYMNRSNIPLSINVKPSIFETNEYLLNANTNLIEYSVFFGSIQIFQFLKLSNVKLTPALWMYAIHGRNPEIIHILEESNILPPDDSFLDCFIESIKCHHNELANYFQNNYLSQDEYEQLENNQQCCLIDYIFQFHNYGFVSDHPNHHLFFCYLCKYSFTEIVNLLIENNCIDFDIKKAIINFLLILQKIQIKMYLCN